MNTADVQAWLNRYVEAWRTNDREQVESLFTEDATYRYHPYGGDSHASKGREAIQKSFVTGYRYVLSIAVVLAIASSVSAAALIDRDKGRRPA